MKTVSKNEGFYWQPTVGQTVHIQGLGDYKIIGLGPEPDVWETLNSDYEDACLWVLKNDPAYLPASFDDWLQRRNAPFNHQTQPQPWE